MLESSLTEDIDGYVLVAQRHDGWDAALALILALDRDHRALLVRLLDRLARIGGGYLDDLDALSTLLSEGESLAEDVEAAREERRAVQGYVEARAARAFLTLARRPLEDDAGVAPRDPLTRAYFLDLERSRVAAPAVPERTVGGALRGLPPAVQRELDEVDLEAAGLTLAEASARSALSAFMAALRELEELEPRLFGERMEELAYLTNVLLAGHERYGARLRPKEAADAVFATVCYGAVLEQRASHVSRPLVRGGAPDALDRPALPSRAARSRRARAAGDGCSKSGVLTRRRSSPPRS